MWRFLPGAINFLMTGFAGLRSHVLGTFGRRRSGRRCAGGLGVLTSSLLARLAGGISVRNEKTKRREQKNSTGFVIKFVAHKFESLSFISSSRASRPPVTSLISRKLQEFYFDLQFQDCSLLRNFQKNQTETPVWCKLVSAVD